MCIKKSRIICDTNVWYNLSGDGYFAYGDILNKYQLVLTNLSLVELISTAKITNKEEDFSKVKDAFIAISKHAIFRSDNDIEHIMNTLKIRFIDEGHPNIEGIYNELLKVFIDAKSCNDLSYDYEVVIQQRKESCQTYVDTLNQQIEYWRNEKKTNPITLEEIRECLIWMMKKEICEYIEKHKIKIENIPFDVNQVDKVISESFDVYLTAFSNHIYKVYNIGSKIKNNDYVDFRNLVYCHDDLKYLTFDTTVYNLLNTHCKDKLISEIEELRNINVAISQAIHINNANK